MRKTILLIGDLKSSYLTQYIENVLEPLDFDIFMQIPKEEENIAKDFIFVHKIHLIKIHERSDNPFYRVRYFGGFLRRIMNIFELSKENRFDYIHIHFVEEYALFIANWARSKKTKLYASFWGSDLLRQTEKYLKREKKYLTNYEVITGDSFVLQDKYKRIYPKLRVRFEWVPFGVSLIPFIDKYSDDVNACKQFLGFPLNKKIVAIGYNAIRQQQHAEVLSELKKIENKSEYFLVFQMSYGKSDGNYLPDLLVQIEKSEFEYKVFKDYLSMDDLAKLRIATDIFINAQTTDAFANSFIENVYTKSIIINAKWLHYPELDMFPLYVNEFSDFNEIPSLLEKRIDDEKLAWNKKCIENRTWENCRKQWAKAYGVEYKE